MIKVSKVYVIAEAGVNHNGDVKLAEKLIDVAASSGADAVKFQTFQAEKLVSIHAPKAKYQQENTNGAKTQLEMLKKLELTKEEFRHLQRYALKKQIDFLSTPFDKESLHFLIRDLGMSTVKIPSGEITNAPFLLACGWERKKMILSTGMCDLSEVRQALGVLAFGLLHNQEEPSESAFEATFSSVEGQKVLKQYVSILYCTTEYPAPYYSVNLRAIHTLQDQFQLPVGLSDHTAGIAIPIGSVALGALIIEKHFTLDQAMEGPDHKASLNPQELSEMIVGIRQMEQALGNGKKIASDVEIKNKKIARKSLVAAKPIQKGEYFTAKNLTVKRPGDAVSPYQYWNYLKKTANRDYREDECIDEY